MGVSTNPKDNNVNVVTDIEHVESHESAVTLDQIKEIPLDEHIKLEVVKFDSFKQQIAALKRKAKGLTIKDENDKEGYKKVKAFWQDVKNLRIGADKLRKELKADYIAIGKAIEAKYNEIEEDLTPIEEPLYKMWKDFDNAAEIAREKEEKLKEEILNNRVKELIENGVTFNGSYYVIGETISLDVVILKGLPDDEYLKLLDRVKGENEKILEAKRLEEQKAEEERVALQKQKEEQEQKEKEFQEREAKLKAHEEQMEKQKQEQLAIRTKSRINSLESLGMTSMGTASGFTFTTANSGFTGIQLWDIENKSDEEWVNILKDLTYDIGQLKYNQEIYDKQQEEKIKAEQALQHKIELRAQQLKDLFSMRLQALKDGTEAYCRISNFEIPNSLFVLPNEVESDSEAKWEDRIEELKAEYITVCEAEEAILIKVQEATEAERKLALSDLELAKEYQDQFPVAPNFKTEAAQKAFMQFELKLGQIMDDFLQAIK